jgi:hypothetical protein
MTASLATLFVDWHDLGPGWYLYLAPLAAGIAVVYKTLKVRHLRNLPIEALWLTLTILAGFVVAAAVLFGLYWGFSAMHS